MEKALEVVKPLDNLPGEYNCWYRDHYRDHRFKGGFVPVRSVLSSENTLREVKDFVRPGDANNNNEGDDFHEDNLKGWFLSFHREASFAVALRFHVFRIIDFQRLDLLIAKSEARDEPCFC